MFVVYSYIDFDCTLMQGQPWSAPADTVARIIGHDPEHGGTYHLRGKSIRTWRVY